MKRTADVPLQCDEDAKGASTKLVETTSKVNTNAPQKQPVVVMKRIDDVWPCLKAIIAPQKSSEGSDEPAMVGTEAPPPQENNVDPEQQWLEGELRKFDWDRPHKTGVTKGFGETSRIHEYRSRNRRFMSKPTMLPPEYETTCSMIKSGANINPAAFILTYPFIQFPVGVSAGRLDEFFLHAYRMRLHYDVSTEWMSRRLKDMSLPISSADLNRLFKGEGSYYFRICHQPTVAHLLNVMAIFDPPPYSKRLERVEKTKIIRLLAKRHLTVEENKVWALRLGLTLTDFEATIEKERASTERVVMVAEQ